VRFDGETAWLSLGQMADLFQRDKSVISRHLKNVFDEGESERAAVVAESATTADDDHLRRRVTVRGPVHPVPRGHAAREGAALAQARRGFEEGKEEVVSAEASRADVARRTFATLPEGQRFFSERRCAATVTSADQLFA
jgi:hypothetical protein